MSNNESLQTTAGQEVTYGQGLPDDLVLRPSIIEMVQRTSQKVTDPAAYGKLRDTMSGTLYPSIGAIPLQVTTTRVYFTPGSDFGSDPLCRSDNGLVPSPFAIMKQAEDCKTCDKSQWGMDSSRPPCREQKRLLFLMEDTVLPYYITVSGASIKPLMGVIQHITKEILSKHHRGIDRNLCDFRFDLKPTSVQGPKGTYYVLNLLNIKEIEEPGKYSSLFQQFGRSRANQAKLAAAPTEERTVEPEAIEP